jgi:predicted PurR-regulated permease PerM
MPAREATDMENPSPPATTSTSASDIVDRRRGGDRRREQVPVKTILATIGLVIATYLSWRLLLQLQNILELIFIAGFFALVLNPAVDFIEHRLKVRRGLAASVVFIVGLIICGLLMYLFIRPLVDQTQQLIDKAPQLVTDAQEGRGTVGRFVDRYDLAEYVSENQARLREAVSDSTGSIVSIASTVASTIATLVTVLVLAFMMLLYGRHMLRVPLVFFDRENQERISKVANDAAKAVTGYVLGNLLISIIAGLVTFVTLSALGVPFAVVLAVFVAFADLIPLVGATLGAIPTIAVAALHSPTAGIVTFIVYVLYQQIENYLIQPAVMARTVNLNPLVILVSALIGVELAGLLGALLAIPIAGAIQVIGRDVFDHESRRFKHEPTIGVDEIPMSKTSD